MLFLACFGASQRVQRRKAEITLAQIRENYQTAGPIGTKFGTHVQIHMGMDIRQTNCPSRHKEALGGFQFKSLGKLSDWHQLWFASADSSGNEHRLNASRPSIHQGGIGGGVSVSQIQKCWEAVKRLDRLAPNLAHICRSIWEWIYAKHKGDTWGLVVRHSKVWGSCQTAGLIGINFGSSLRIHIGMVIG